MFFQYLGTEPLDVCPPKQHLGHQQKFTIYPSPNGQATNNETLLNWLFDDEFEHKDLFKKVTGFHLVQEEPEQVAGNVYNALAHTQDFSTPAPQEHDEHQEGGD